MNALFQRSPRANRSGLQRFRFKVPAFLTLESVIWMGALLWLGLFANLEQQSWSLCPLHALGLDFCPGCGLGRAIGLVLRGQFVASWAAHPLGIPAFLILLHRVVVLSFPGLPKMFKSPRILPLPFFPKFARHERS